MNTGSELLEKFIEATAVLLILPEMFEAIMHIVFIIIENNKIPQCMP